VIVNCSSNLCKKRKMLLFLKFKKSKNGFLDLFPIFLLTSFSKPSTWNSGFQKKNGKFSRCSSLSNSFSWNFLAPQFCTWFEKISYWYHCTISKQIDSECWLSPVKQSSFVVFIIFHISSFIINYHFMFCSRRIQQKKGKVRGTYCTN